MFLSSLGRICPQYLIWICCIYSYINIRKLHTARCRFGATPNGHPQKRNPSFAPCQTGKVNRAPHCVYFRLSLSLSLSLPHAHHISPYNGLFPKYNGHHTERRDAEYTSRRFLWMYACVVCCWFCVERCGSLAQHWAYALDGWWFGGGWQNGDFGDSTFTWIAEHSWLFVVAAQQLYSELKSS